MKTRFAFVAAIVLALSVLASGASDAATVKASFDYHIGDGFLNNTGDKAAAENGDVVTVTGGGAFDVVTKEATGGGKFTHRAASGAVLATGTWKATELLAFQSYGDGSAQGLPAFLFGGRAALVVALTPHGTTLQIPGILRVECLLGSPPGGAAEGIRLLVKGHVNFNKTVPESGQTVFVLH